MCSFLLCLIIFLLGVISLSIICISVDLFVLFGLSKVKIFLGLSFSDILERMWCWLKEIEIFFREIRFVMLILVL